MAGNQLADYPEATTFLFSVIPHDPSARVRDLAIMNSYFYAHMRSDSLVRGTLEWMAVEDPNPLIARRALNQLRAFSIKPLRQLVDLRMKAARARGDSAVTANAELEDEWSNADAGLVLPSFMRRSPPVFAAAPANRPIRVLAFGDWGTGRPSQIETAAAMRAYHAKRPFSFGITLGDNFYPEGVESPSDPRWRTQYEELYSPMNVKIYGVLGNHDRYNGETPAAEILYSQRSPTWRMPAQNYTFTAGAAQFWAVDGSDMTELQLRWLRASLDSSKARWKIVYSHYPLYSSSDLGGREGHLYPKLFPVLDGRADVFVAGHHHSMQHIQPMGKLNLFIAGSGGASSYGVNEKDPRAIFARSSFGFAVMDVTPREFTVQFIDTKQGEIYKTTITK
jgi:predicted phosphodiesterase